MFALSLTKIDIDSFHIHEGDVDVLMVDVLMHAAPSIIASFTKSVCDNHAGFFSSSAAAFSAFSASAAFSLLSATCSLICLRRFASLR